jgi:quercetin dioxygenase-like cupin family protein
MIAFIPDSPVTPLDIHLTPISNLKSTICNFPTIPMPPYTYLPNLSSLISEIPPDSIVSRTYYSDAQIKVILFGFAAGQELSEHTASKPAVIHILSGQARLTLGGDSFEAGPGAWAHMPPNMPHSVYAHTPVTMLLTLLESAVVGAPAA